MNPWLITWEPSGERIAKTITNRIAAILPNRTSDKQVEKTLYLLQANYAAYSGWPDSLYISEQVRFAKRHYAYKAVWNGFEEITCGGNPFLFARRVFNLQVSEQDGYEVLIWQENIYPNIDSTKDPIDQIKANRPFQKKWMTFSAKTNSIDRLHK